MSLGSDTGKLLSEGSCQTLQQVLVARGPHCGLVQGGRKGGIGGWLGRGQQATWWGNITLNLCV